MSDIVQLRSSDNFFLFAVKHFELLPPADWHFWETSAAALAIYFCESSIFLNHTHTEPSLFFCLSSVIPSLIPRMPLFLLTSPIHSLLYI